jgi:hypothetical protein
MSLTIPAQYTETDLRSTSMDSMRIFLSPQVTVVDVEHTLIHKRSLVCPQNVV